LALIFRILIYDINKNTQNDMNKQKLSKNNSTKLQIQMPKIVVRKIKIITDIHI
tara:strand:+ start:450 stop:611 length:162 start_codon:yes stop_codon:yes gene_type:complete